MVRCQHGAGDADGREVRRTFRVISRPAMIRPRRAAWNKGRIAGQPLVPKHVWAIRVRVELANIMRDPPAPPLAIWRGLK
jgi:hypothetical protein